MELARVPGMYITEPDSKVSGLLKSIIEKDEQNRQRQFATTKAISRPTGNIRTEGFASKEVESDDEEEERPVKKKVTVPSAPKTPSTWDIVTVCNFFVVTFFVVAFIDYFGVTNRLVSSIMRNSDRHITAAASAMFQGVIVAVAATLSFILFR